MIVNGTTYHDSTPAEVVRILEEARASRTRLHLALGEPETGRDWNEVHDVAGYIGRSGGSIKIPLLIHNARCMGGPALLDHCIVRIQTARGKRVLWQHPTYHVAPAAEGDPMTGLQHNWKDQPHNLTGCWLQECTRCGAARELVADEDGATTLYYDADGTELDYIPECEEVTR